MISIGVDAHKRLHVAVARDERGQVLGQWHGPNSAAGWETLASWASQFAEVRQWGIEGAWNYGRGLAQYLVGGGEAVYEVNTRWTARGRRQARGVGKTDVRDAQAIALVVWREAATLPRVSADDATAVLDVLVTQREAALAEATRLRNQAHQLLLQSEPTYRERLPCPGRKGHPFDFRLLGDRCDAGRPTPEWHAPALREVQPSQEEPEPAEPAPGVGGHS
jgi:transposase